MQLMQFFCECNGFCDETYSVPPFLVGISILLFVYFLFVESMDCGSSALPNARHGKPTMVSAFDFFKEEGSLS